MNKKLIASLLTLGLVLSPVSGAVSESYATEVSSERSELNKEEMASLIKAYIEDFDHTKGSQVYRFAGKDAQDNLSKAIDEAKEIIIKTSPSADKLKDSISSIETAYKSLAEKAKANVDADAINKDIKTNLLKIVKLLEKHGDKAEDPKYKEGLALVDKSKEQLETENFAKAKAEDLLSLNLSLDDFFTKYKDALSDSEDYNPSEDEINAFEANLDKTKYENIKADFEALDNSHKAFVESDKFILASDSLKKAYKDAYEVLEKNRGNTIDKATYEDIAKAVKNLADAKYNIDSQATDYKYIENKPSSEDILKKLSAYVKESKATLDGLKDVDLESKYKAAIAKAIVYKTSHENGIKRDLKDYQELEAQLKDLTEKINKAKDVKAVPKEENKKFDKLKSSIEKGNKFFYSDAYDKADKEKKDKFFKALVGAEALRDKYEKDPASVKDEEIEKATKALDDALASFDKFSDKDKARDAIKGLLGLTKGIKIEQIYDTKDTKESKEAYTKAREKAAKLADDKKASLEDLDKSYKDFNESVVKLAEFLTSRLQKLVDDDKTFRDSDKYKDAEKDSKKEEAIKNYKKLVEDGEKELKKAAPDANILNVIYKKLADARAEIKGDMTSQARKLSYAIYDSYLFLETEDYKKAAVSSNENIKDAAKNYKELVEAAKALKEAGKLDSQEAKDLLDSINNAKDFMDGKISKEKYLSNKYYYILKAVREYKNGEEYKKLPQALRQKLDDALKLYETSSDEKAVFSALDAVWQEKEIQEIIKKIEWEKNPNKTRDKLLEDLNNLIAEDKKLKEGSFKYKKAQKALRDAYDLALSEAKDFINKNDKPTEEQVRAVYNKLLNAKNALDGDKFDKLIHDLAARFKKDQMKIANPADRKAIADKINGLSGENMTMDDALRVEKELNDLINPKFAATQTLVPQGQAPTTSRPISTVTNPGSIVKTGINGIAKVAVVLVAALGIFILTSKKGDKNENN